MIYSNFGLKLTSKSGILQLMDDLGKPIPEGLPSYQLGGGNPARIAQVEEAYRREMEKLLQSGDAFENAIARYDAPQGRIQFIEAIAQMLNKNYGWNVQPENIAITNGSQSAFFYLFNLYSGDCSHNGVQLAKAKSQAKRTVLFPLVPEYIGYADQGIEDNTFVSLPARSEYYDDHIYKYFIDYPRIDTYLREHTEVAAMCVSRPTNPTGNVLTDTEIQHLAKLAEIYNIPLFIDNAYGVPFPNIIFTENATPFWNEHTVLAMSLSKIGLPALRTGIIIASPSIVKSLAALNSIVALASGSLGQVLAEGLIQSGEILQLANSYVRPFYYEKSQQAQKWIHEFFQGRAYYIHKSEGSLFNWLLLDDLKIPSIELYSKLKEHGVVTVPGEYFFFGSGGTQHEHAHKCLRLNYSRPADEVREGLRLISAVSAKYRL